MICELCLGPGLTVSSCVLALITVFPFLHVHSSDRLCVCVSPSSGEARSYECLSSDTQKNALAALVRMGAVSKSRA